MRGLNKQATRARALPSTADSLADILPSLSTRSHDLSLDAPPPIRCASNRPSCSTPRNNFSATAWHFGVWPEPGSDNSRLSIFRATLLFNYLIAPGDADFEFLLALFVGIFAIFSVLCAWSSIRALRRHKTTIAMLRARQEGYALAFDNSNDGIWDFDVRANRIHYSERARDILGHDQATLGDNPAGLKHVIVRRDLASLRRSIVEQWSKRDTSLIRHRLRIRKHSGTLHSDGLRWILLQGASLYFSDGTPRRMAGSCTDITEWVAHEMPLRLAASVFEYNLQAIVIADSERRIVSVNQAFQELSGYRSEQVLGQSVSALRAHSVSVDTYEKIWEIVKAKGYWRGETIARTSSGEERPVEISLVRVKGADGSRDYYIYSGTDISERQYAAARIRHLAYTDNLTGLPNRSYANLKFDELVIEARNNQRGFAVLLFDLDGFKELNDALGHVAGDKVIVEQAHRLRHSITDNETVFRFGGDEFLVLLPDSNSLKAQQLATSLLQQLEHPIALAGRDVIITASAGISEFPVDGTEVDSLVRAADSALHRAKSHGKHTAVRFRPGMDMATTSRFEMLNQLRVALDKNQFQLWFQPTMDGTGHRIVGAEALLYWNHPQRGLLSPTAFIGLAEESGLIEPIGAWVVTHAAECYVQWREQGLPPIQLSINFSTQQLHHPQTFLHSLENAIGGGKIQPENLVLEITERQVVHDMHVNLPIFESFTRQGVGLAIDDFGTGYSSLSYLKNLPVSEIKIDSVFIRNLLSGNGDRVIVKAIIDLARSLQLNVVAEGVETREQLAILHDCGCQMLQGFYFSRPLPAAEFLAFAQRFTAEQSIPESGTSETAGCVE